MGPVPASAIAPKPLPHILGKKNKSGLRSPNREQEKSHRGESGKRALLGRRFRQRPQRPQRPQPWLHEEPRVLFHPLADQEKRKSKFQSTFRQVHILFTPLPFSHLERDDSLRKLQKRSLRIGPTCLAMLKANSLLLELGTPKPFRNTLVLDWGQGQSQGWQLGYEWPAAESPECLC